MNDGDSEPRKLKMKYIRIKGGEAFMAFTNADVSHWSLYGVTFSEWAEETGKDYQCWICERVIPVLDLFDYIAWYEDGSLRGYEGGYNVELDPSFGLWTAKITERAEQMGLPVVENQEEGGCWLG
jgi:hypothetical protein